MAQIDALLQSLARFGAEGALLVSGERVQLSFPTGNRYATQTTPHAALVALVEEIVPKGVVLKHDGATSFVYNANGVEVTIRIEASRNVWKVAIQPKVAAAPSPVPIAAPRPRRSFAGISVETAIERLLVEALEMGASDLHLATGAPPYARMGETLQPIPGHAPWTEDDLLARLHEITPERSREEFDRTNSIDFAFEIAGASRFRANLFRDRRGPGAVFRAVPLEIPTPGELGLPPAVLDLCALKEGLVLITGPARSGKSTTLASMIDRINQNRPGHIVTIERPIEFVHENKRCLINQREVGPHAESFSAALRSSSKEDPDVIVVGELEDPETIAAAVEIAQGGHLIFGTLLAHTAPGAIDRILEKFPADQREPIRSGLAATLKGILSQMLCERIGGGRIAVFEFLLSHPAVANLIHEKKIFQIDSVMRTSRTHGMTTFNDTLIALVKNKVIDVREARRVAIRKTDFESRLAREGISGPATA